MEGGFSFAVIETGRYGSNKIIHFRTNKTFINVTCFTIHLASSEGLGS